MKRSPIKRKTALKSVTPLKVKRSRPRKRKTVVRLTGKALEELREKVYARAGGRCENCKRPLLLSGGSDWYRMHLAHTKSRGASGSDNEDNTRCLCLDCHIGKDHNCGGSPMQQWRQEQGL